MPSIIQYVAVAIFSSSILLLSHSSMKLVHGNDISKGKMANEFVKIEDDSREVGQITDEEDEDEDIKMLDGMVGRNGRTKRRRRNYGW